MKKTARSHINIALIKYWGKKDKTLNLPLTSSVSLTLDQFYTTTTVEYKKGLTEDHLYIDGRFITGDELKRVSNFMDEIRKRYNIPYYALIDSYNYVPKKAGIASSSSAFSALALAATEAFGVHLSQKELSSLARLGSGSASRSIISGFAIWHEGDSHESSYAESFYDYNDVAVIIAFVDKNEKKVGSRDAMNILTDFPELKNEWITLTNDHLERIKLGFINQDFNIIGTTLESHAIKMHELIEKTGITYLTDKSREIIQYTHALREKGYPVYVSMDAGPNVKIFTKKSSIKDVLPLYQKITEVVVCNKGKGAYLI
ncbi:diphosphomevalonate decarboxylase [Acholeplasma equifetale]|uniref:diphosphomevalonate decarboxylase n=1 Tax=Acholeplasma equifetale TaxID=264634 RepID=UPI00138B029A|nr:diphosphomevalonate decarboxylase [Acholeplasma equifetale]